MTTDFERIKVNMETGEVVYPQPDGFVLDEEAAQRMALRFVEHCPPEQAVRLAIHQQLVAFRGSRPLARMLAEQE